jgi:hypothetical protein
MARDLVGRGVVDLGGEAGETLPQRQMRHGTEERHGMAPPAMVTVVAQAVDLAPQRSDHALPWLDL